MTFGCFSPMELNNRKCDNGSYGHTPAQLKGVEIQLVEVVEGK